MSDGTMREALFEGLLRQIPLHRLDPDMRDEIKAALRTPSAHTVGEDARVRLAQAYRSAGFAEAADVCAKGDPVGWITEGIALAAITSAQPADTQSTEQCVVCGGRFDKGEWVSSEYCPECEAPKPADTQGEV